MLETCSQNLDFLYRNHEKELGSHIWCTYSTHGYYKLIQYHRQTPTQLGVMIYSIFSQDFVLQRNT